MIERIADLMHQLSQTAAAPVEGAGIGCPGLVEVPRGITRYFSKLPAQWRELPAAEVLTQRLNCPVSLLNGHRREARRISPPRSCRKKNGSGFGRKNRGGY